MKTTFPMPCTAVLLLCALAILTTVSSLQAQTYPIVSTGQTKCYDTLRAIPPPQPGQPFFGQDMQQPRISASYTPGADGRTVHDNVTGLTWQRSPDTNGDGAITRADKLTWTQVQQRPSQLNAAAFGGFTDWRLPTIKELYSLIMFNGTDPSGLSGTDTQGLTPFIDTTYFRFAYGDTGAGERIIDAQFASSTMYVVKTQTGSDQLFGVNFADGRIKGYDLRMPGGREFVFFVLCVRGNAYGANDFVDNLDSTITDRATGLMWDARDAGELLDWPDALAWVQSMNSRRHRGHADWRLPSVKELQSIVDYTRAPSFTQSAAIDPLFQCTPVTNELGQADFASYWSSTSHVTFNGMAAAAAYVAFGRAMGYLGGIWQDVHGAGCQRSDPKTGDPANFPQGRGPQGDAIRIYNAVRLVRTATPVSGVGEGSDADAHPDSFGLEQNHPNPFNPSTVITCVVPAQSHVRLSVHDALGREVALLVDDVRTAGRHAFVWDAAGCASGTYICVLRSGSRHDMRMMTLQR